VSFVAVFFVAASHVAVSFVTVFLVAVFLVAVFLVAISVYFVSNNLRKGVRNNQLNLANHYVLGDGLACAGGCWDVLDHVQCVSGHALSSRKRE
jgi:hypothetical protein